MALGPLDALSSWEAFQFPSRCCVRFASDARFGRSLEQEDVVHARLSFIEGPPDGMEAGTVSFRDAVVPTVRQDGGRGAILLIDRENGKAIGITLWPDEATMRASEEDANRLRAQAAGEVHATAPPRGERYVVEGYESF